MLIATLHEVERLMSWSRQLGQVAGAVIEALSSYLMIGVTTCATAFMLRFIHAVKKEFLLLCWSPWRM